MEVSSIAGYDNIAARTKYNTRTHYDTNMLIGCHVIRDEMLKDRLRYFDKPVSKVAISTSRPL